MPHKTSLGEFEHLVLLAILQLKEEARAIDLRAHLEERTPRSVSRGALYSALERLEKKGFLSWRVEDSTPERGGIPRRCFFVTDLGLDAVRSSMQAISSLSEGLEEVLGG